MKKSLVFFVMLVLLFSLNETLTGCGRTVDTEPGKEKSTTETAVETATEVTADLSTESTVTPDEPATTPEEAVSTPEEAVSTPEEAVSTPEEAVSTPEEAVSTPEEAVSTPEEAVSTPEEAVVTDGGSEPVADTTPETPAETVQEFSGTGPNPAAENQIKSVRGGQAGKIDGAAVTYLRPKIGSDPVGFFVQATSTGPALFVAVDPTTTSPVLKVGDIVSFEVTTVDTNAATQTRIEATAIKDLKVLSSGYDVSQLVQDVTNSNDIVSALDSYADELIKLEGKVIADFAGAGAGFLSAQIDTKGVTANTGLVFRILAGATGQKGLNELIGLVKGCEFSTTPITMWRFKTTAQPSAFLSSEIKIKSCPAPKLLSAVATNATTVELTFDRPIDNATVKSNGSDFLFDNGLSASAAAVSGNTVTVTTGTQDGIKTYKVTAAAGIKDNLGNVLDSTALSTTFKGFNSPAIVLINEVNANLADGCDLVELRVKQGGSMDGYTLYDRTTKAVTFTGLVVKKNDLILVHFDSGDTKCYSVVPKNETTAPNEVPQNATTAPANYDTAYDWYSTATIAASTGVLTVRNAKDEIIDAVVLRDASSTASSTALTAANLCLTAKAWGPATGTPPASYDAASFSTDAVSGLNTTGTTRTAGTTIQRKDNNDTNTKSDWTDQETQTWGAKNKGQTDF